MILKDRARERESFFLVKNQVELTFIEKTKADHELQKEGHQVEPLSSHM